MAGVTLRVVQVRSNLLQSRYRQFLLTPGGPIRQDLSGRMRRVKRRMFRLIPFDTGTLAGTIRGPVHGTSRGMPHADVQVGRSGVTPYLGYLIRGTEPHEIRPRRARALRFEVQGAQVFANRVQHPGTRPRRGFIDNVLDAAG